MPRSPAGVTAHGTISRGARTHYDKQPERK